MMAVDNFYTEYTHYISIDFGTSGCAIAVGFSKPEPKKIRVFSGWVGQKIGVQAKYPTILLADPQGEFVSFGDKAFDSFRKLKDEAKDYHLFHRFKMKLYDAPDAEHIEAFNGKSLPAVDVFAMALKFLKDTALEWVQKLTEHPCQKIQWIVTVPAIWSDAAKDVMRKAAMKVELKRESMVFAYEPEAAALFTQYDFLHSEKCFVEFCYLVVDCGGGTVDIAAHKIAKQYGNIVINDIAHPHGGNCGGFAVNDQFEKLLIDILRISPEKFNQMKIICPVQWNTLINKKFEYTKYTLDPNDKSSTITLEFPSKICDEMKKLAGKSIEDLIDDYGNENIQWDDDDSAIVLGYPVIDKLFKPILDEICMLIKTVLAKPECVEVKTILLVGGFADSANLFQRIKNTFGSDYDVNRSTTPGFSVVKGAVLCGQQEMLIRTLLEKMNDKQFPFEREFSPSQSDELSNTQSDSTQQDTDSVSSSPTGNPERSLSPSAHPVESSMQIVKYLPPAEIEFSSLEDLTVTDQPTTMKSEFKPPQNESSNDTQSVVVNKHPISVESPLSILNYLPPAITKHLPFVLSRKMKHTVGVGVVKSFQSDNHDVDKMVYIDGEQYCDDIFFTLVRVNESVQAGSPKRKYSFYPITKQQSTLHINIYTSNKEDVKYTDDEGCQYQQNAVFNIPDHDTGLSREVEVCVNFYNTEIEIEAYSITNNEVKKICVDY